MIDSADQPQAEDPDDAAVTAAAQGSPALTRNQLAGIARGTARSEQLKKDIEDAMRVIEKEMAGNGGIYSGNGGAVTLNEVSRRAKCHPTTLHKPHNEKLKELVDVWLEKLKETKPVARMQVRRALEESAQAWRRKCEALQTTEIATNLRLQQLQSELAATKSELGKAKAEVEALKIELARQISSKVIPMTNRETR